MALQIANPKVVAKIHELSLKTGMTKTAAVEKAVDELLKTLGGNNRFDRKTNFLRLLEQFDRSPKVGNVEGDITWDEFGLPK